MYIVRYVIAVKLKNENFNVLYVHRTYIQSQYFNVERGTDPGEVYPRAKNMLPAAFTFSPVTSRLGLTANKVYMADSIVISYCSEEFNGL